MRITNTMMANNFLRNLGTNMSAMDKYQTQMQTGKRINKLSDDPVGILKSMQARVRLYRLDQHTANVDTAQEWLTQVESTLKEMNGLVVKSYELVLEVANSYNNSLDKSAVGEIIGQYKEHMMTLGNAAIGDRYLFGGFNTVKQPFSTDPVTGKILYNGIDMSNAADPGWPAEDSQVLQFEIGFGITTNVTYVGSEVMGKGDDNIYNILGELEQLLKSDADPSQLSPYITKLQNAQNEILALTADTGGRTARLDLVTNRYEDDILNYEDMKSKIEDVDEAEAIMHFKMAEALYLSALEAGAKVLQPSLLNYLN